MKKIIALFAVTIVLATAGIAQTGKQTSDTTTMQHHKMMKKGMHKSMHKSMDSSSTGGDSNKPM